MGAKEVKWLFEELPGLVDSGVVTGEEAERIRTHYASLPVKRRLPLAMLLLGVLSALFIGLGIILVLASNWQQLSRPVRAAVAFAPMLAAQALVGWTLLRRPQSTPLREGGGTFLVLAVAACIALIGQTYNIPGSLAGFLFAWMPLTLPVGYLLRAVLPSVLYIAMTVYWAFTVQVDGGEAMLFWPLLALIVPHYAIEWRSAPFGPRAAFLGWALGIAAAIGTGIALEKNLPGLWIVVYASLFGALYLGGALWQEEGRSAWRRPFHTLGAAGTAILALLLSFRWPWESIGWHHYRRYSSYVESAALADYIVAGVLTATAITLLVTLVARGRRNVIPFGVMPILAILAYAWAASATPDLSMLLFNFYLLALGIVTLAAGIRHGRLATVNGGMFLLSALIIARFFDSGMSFAARGVAFIVLGLIFLGTNLILLRQSARHPGSTP
jgi:uncharacterized membrane protein